jgi:sulfur relay (sulfurtransferase) DsrF/TusC family protein
MGRYAVRHRPDREDVLESVSAVIGILLVLGVPLAAIAVRTWIRSFIENRVQLGMQRQMEDFRSEIRQSEERLSSQLRTREAEITALRDGVLSGRATRMAVVDKRRVEAVERLWIAVTRLSRMKGPAMSLSVLRVDAIAKRVSVESNVREFVELMTTTMGGENFEQRMGEIRADEERPFVSELVWALYSAYAAVVLGAWAVMKVLSLGAEDVDKLINHQHVNDLLKAALPRQAEYIEKYGSSAHYHLLDELERRIITELKRTLAGEDADSENLRHSSEIMRQVAQVTSDTQKLSEAVVV